MAQSKEALKYEIDKEKEGLFVIIKQLTHNFYFEHRSDVSLPNDSKPEEWRHSDENNCFWGNSTLNYTADEKKLLKVFGLEGHDMSHKLLHGKELTNDAEREELTNGAEEEESFEDFMKKVCDQRPPAFLMFFLMSHGFPKGEFLLARTHESPVGPCCVDKDGKKKKRHDLAGSCYGRRIDKDIIDKVGESYPDIPKIYIIQTCRGVDKSPTHKSEADKKVTPTEPSDIELFMPNHQHTFVFRACIEGNLSFVSPKGCDERVKEGSLLIQYLCEALRELKESSSQYNKLVTRAEQGNCPAEFVTCLEESREDMIGGWMMNLCQRATSMVTRFLYIKITLERSNLDLFFEHWPVLESRIMCPAENTQQALQEELVGTLTDYMLKSGQKSDVQKVLKGVNRCSKRHIIQYLWKRFNLIKRSWDPLNSEEELDNLNILDSLDAIISEAQNPEPDFNQQPHISSSLCKKLSVLDLSIC